MDSSRTSWTVQGLTSPSRAVIAPLRSVPPPGTDRYVSSDRLPVRRSNRLSYCRADRGGRGGHHPLRSQPGAAPSRSTLGERGGHQGGQRHGSRSVDWQMGSVAPEPLRIPGRQGGPVGHHHIRVSGSSTGEHSVVGVLPGTVHVDVDEHHPGQRPEGSTSWCRSQRR